MEVQATKRIYVRYLPPRNYPHPFRLPSLWTIKI